MSNITHGLRLFIGLALTFAVGATIAPATTSAQNGGTAYVEIHNRICPPGYDGDNFFEDCHDNPPDPGLPFSLTNDVEREGTTDAAGNVVFGELPEGVYTIVGGAPLHSAEMVVFCSFADDIESPAEFGRTNGAIDLFVPADTGIICDWYNIPVPAEEPGTSSVELLKRVCPPGFEGPGFFEACDVPQADVQFSLDGLQGTTDATGSILFFDLQEATYTITEDTVPGGTSDYVVYCRLAEDPDAALDFAYVNAGPTGAGIQLYVPPATDIICGWYNIPIDVADGTGRVELHKGLCPPGYTGDDFIQDCFNGNRQPGVLFSLDGREGTTGEGGVVAFDNLPEATYTIIEHTHITDFVVSCALAEPAVPPVEFTYIEGGISLFVPEGHDIICHWSNIPVDPVEPAPPPAPPVDDVPRLPDVGTGTTAGGSHGGGMAPALMALATAATALAGFAVSRRLFGISAG